MKIRRFVSKRRRRFRKAVENGLNAAHVRANDRPFMLDRIVAEARRVAEGRPRY